MNDSKGKQQKDKPSRFQIRFDTPEQREAFERLIEGANKISPRGLKTRVR